MSSARSTSRPVRSRPSGRSTARFRESPICLRASWSGSAWTSWSGSIPTPLTTLAIDFTGNGNLVDLGFLPSSPPGVPAPSGLHRFDLAGKPDGELVPLHPLQDRFATGLAIRPPLGACAGGPALPIPAASPLGLLAIAAGLAVAGALLLARRRSPGKA